MYPGLQAKIRPQQPAFTMAQSGETVTYAELERRSNQLAHFSAGERPLPARPLRDLSRPLRDLYGEQRPMKNNAPREPLTRAQSLNRAVAASYWLYSDDIRSDTRGVAETGPNPGPLPYGGDNTVLD